MALTDLRRIVLGTLALLLALLAVVFSNGSRGGASVMRRPAAPPPNARAIAAGQLSEANERWRLLELRDSVASLAKRQPGNQPAVFLDEALPEPIRRGLSEKLASQWPVLVAAPRLRLVLAVVLDTVTSPHGQIRSFRFPGAIPIDAFMPSVATDGACISVARVSTMPPGRMGAIVMQNLLSAETVAALLNPCALLAAFGEPGPQVARWLRDERWTIAKFADWSAAPSPWKNVARPQRPIGMPTGWLAALGDPTWQVRGYVAPEGIACLAGEVGVCKRITLSHAASRADSTWRNAVVSSSGTNASSFFLPARVSNLGPADGWLVSEMVRTLGHDRFTRFWRSPLPVDSAFKDASGQDLDSWVRDWGRRTYGAAEVGPSISTLGVLAGIIVLCAGLGVSIAVELKRRVA